MSGLPRLKALIKPASHMAAGAVMFAAVALLTGCRSESDHSVPSATQAATTPNLDAEIARASTLRQPILVLVAESGLSRADDQARTLLENLTAKNDSIVSVLLDLSVSRNRATAARFHITNTPVLLCLSSKGLIVSRDAAPITHALLTKRVEEVARKGP